MVPAGGCLAKDATSPVLVTSDLAALPPAPMQIRMESAQNPCVLPEWASVFSLTVTPEDRSANERAVAGIPLPSELANAVSQRQFDFRAGRFCARQALRALDPTLAAASLARTRHGAVAWPSGVTGSISHTRDFVWAAVARSTDASAIGIDCEPVMSTERADHVTRVIAAASEVDAGRAAGLDRLTALTLVFTTKESNFKCVHAQVGRTFGFHDVRIVHVDAVDRRFRARIATTLSPSLACGTELTGRFAIDTDRIHTGLFLPPHQDADQSRRI
jgi:enterobactin synthetase component D